MRAEDFPVPSKRTPGKVAALKAEKKKIGVEMAAMAFVAMESDEWVYAPGSRKQFDKEGYPKPNKNEVMRRAGYRGSAIEKFDELLAPNEYFWEMVALFRVRRTDPMFHADQQKDIWKELGGDSLRALYEKVHYYPHQVPTADHLKIVRLVLDAGLAGLKIGDPGTNKSDELLSDIKDPEVRTKMIGDYKASLQREQERMEELELAHKGASHEQE